MKIWFFFVILKIAFFFNSRYPHKSNIIHFINCGHGDSILIEGNGHYGLIDSTSHYKVINKKINIKKKKNNFYYKKNKEFIILRY